MALIACSECGHKVSDKASACPSCGNPLSSIPAHQSSAPRRPSGAESYTITDERVQTIQQTSKRYKAAMLWGGIGMIIGVIMVMGDAQVLGGLLLAGGFVAYLYGRFGAWWHHA